MKNKCREISDVECAKYGDAHNACKGCPAIGTLGKKFDGALAVEMVERIEGVFRKEMGKC